MKRLYTDIYQRGNDYDQAEIFTKAPCGPYVTIEMLNAIVNKLIDLINQKQDDLNLGYIDYDGDTFLHDVNDSAIYAEAASNAINDENGENIAETYLKKVDQTYQYNSSGEIVGINNSAIYCGGKGAKELVGADGIYIEDDLTANIIGISANYAYASSLSGYQPKLTEEQMIDIESIPFKLNTFDFEETISSYATLDDLYDTLSGYYNMDETSGANELSAAFDLKQDKLSAGTTIQIVDNVIDVKNNACSSDAKSLALGDQTEAYGTYSFAYGKGAPTQDKNHIASGAYCINLGCHSTAIGNYSTVLGGNYCLASGAIDPTDGKQYWGPVAQGVRTSAIGQYSHAEGNSTLARGEVSHAEGRLTSAIKFASHSEGSATMASGNCSHAEGYVTSALGYASNAQGAFTKAQNDAAHAEGYGTVATGLASHAEGYYTSANAEYTHSEGYQTVANSFGAHSHGNATSAMGDFSYADGSHTIASERYTVALGKYNDVNSAAFIIGNGRYDEDISAAIRSDAFVVDWDGTASAVKLATSGIPDIEETINEKQKSWSSASIFTLTTTYDIANNTITRIENNNVNDIIEFNITGLSSNEVPNVSVEFINNQAECYPVFKNNNFELYCNNHTCTSGKNYMFRALGSMSELIEMSQSNSNIAVNGTNVSVNGDLVTP